MSKYEKTTDLSLTQNPSVHQRVDNRSPVKKFIDVMTNSPSAKIRKQAQDAVNAAYIDEIKDTAIAQAKNAGQYARLRDHLAAQQQFGEARLRAYETTQSAQRAIAERGTDAIEAAMRMEQRALSKIDTSDLPEGKKALLAGSAEHLFEQAQIRASHSAMATMDNVTDQLNRTMGFRPPGTSDE